jgi:hypothetical protein
MFIGFGYWFCFGDVNSPLMLSSWAGRTIWVLTVIAHSVVWVICAGVVVLVLLLLCWWCCAGEAVLVMLCWWGCAGDAGRLGFLVDQFHTQWPFYTSPWVLVPWHLPACTWWLCCLLARWLGRPAWSLADILRVSHVDNINTLMIINSVFILICYCHLYYPWWHFSLHFLYLQVTRRIKKKGRKDGRSK